MKILPLIGAIVGTTFLPVVLLCLLPFLVYRWILSIMYPLISGPTLKILPPASSNYATQNKEIHVMSNILIELQFENQLNNADVLAAIDGRMIQAKDRKGRALYPELTHYVSPAMGYYFWREESNFQIQDHVQLVPGVPNSDLKESFLQEHFHPDRSPWKMLVLGTEGDRRILFKYHHTLGDGYSILNVLMSCSHEAPLQRRTASIDWWKIPIFPIVALYDLFNAAGVATPSPWDKPISERSNFRIYSKPRCVRKEVITEGSKALSVSFTSALFGAIGVGIRRFLAEGNTPILPEMMNAFVPFPGSSHSKKLDNSYGIASVQIPTGPGVEDGIKAVEANMNLMKNSTYPLTILLLLKLFGLLPFAAYRQKPKVPPLFISALPGPKKAMFLAGNPITGLNFQMHLGGDFPLLINSLTYEDTLSYVLGGDQNVFTEQSLEDLSTFIYQEFLSLRNDPETPCIVL